MARVKQLLVNGARRAIDSDPDRSLLQVLREDLGLTGAKYGCGEGQCGACTVLVEDRPVRACLTPVSAAAGRRITTIEGLAQGERLHPVQEAFLEAEALQCGYCTPGMIMSAVGLLRRSPRPSDAEIRRAMEGNLCRCGMYRRILEAIRTAARRNGTPGTNGARRAPGAGSHGRNGGER